MWTASYQRIYQVALTLSAQSDDPALAALQSEARCRQILDPWTWSTWRRRHQYRARTSHYQRQRATMPGTTTTYGWSPNR